MSDLLNQSLFTRLTEANEIELIAIAKDKGLTKSALARLYIKEGIRKDLIIIKKRSGHGRGTTS